MKKIYLALLLLVANYSFAQITITLQPDSNNSEFATITTQNPTGQYGDRNVFQCSAWTIGGTPYLWNSLLKFDLSSIPSNAIIDSAFISLFGYIGPWDYHSAISGSNDSRLVRITSSWNEISVTWNTQPTTTDVDSVYLPMSNTPGEDFLNYDIKNMVQYWISNPANNFGFMYKLNTEQYYRRMSFHSPVSDTAIKHPKLVITYHIPVQDCIILQPDSNICESATISTQYPTTPDFTSEIFQCSAWTIGGIPYQWNSLLKFDLSAIPSNAIVDSAFILLYGYIGPYDYHAALSGSNDSKLVRVTSSWQEHSVTWNTQPTITSVDSVYLPMSNTPGEDFLHYDIKNIVQYWVANPVNNFGLMYKLNTEQYYRRMSFHSPVSADSMKRPLLKICYSIPQGIVNNASSSEVHIYPNPSNGDFIILFENTFQKGSIWIFNSIGQQVYSENISSPISKKEINLNLPSGIYYVRINDGNNFYTQKMVIQ
jgi:hypothetical protein